MGVFITLLTAVECQEVTVAQNLQVDASSSHEESKSSLYEVSAKARLEQCRPGRCRQGRKTQSVGSHVSGARPAPEFVPSLLSV